MTQQIILVDNDEIVSDIAKVSEIMNDYFVNITKGLDIKVPYNDNPEKNDVTCIVPIDQIIIGYSKHRNILKITERIGHTTEFSFERVTPPHIEKQISDLIPKKPVGYDSIPPKILKDSISIVREPLFRLFNTSVKENLFPSELKYANVSPLFKNDDNTNKENYTPISILPTISKIFERLLFQQITSFVSNIISPYLCGFRKDYNTHHDLLCLMNKLNKCHDKKQKVGLFMMDLSKVFDCIPHDLMIAKFCAYGFSRESLKFIYSYLKGRKQRVNINISYSSWKEILNGVPQGSILGPLLFNLLHMIVFLLY